LPEKKRIIIVGAPRSGTTALKRLLGSNPHMEFLPYSNEIEKLEEEEGKYSPDTIKVWKRTKWLQEEPLSKLVDLYASSTLFVVIYRYPRDCYFSLLELNERRGHRTHKWLNYESEGAFLDWIESTYEKAAPILKGIDHSFVSYEKFCVDPLSYKRDLLTMVGIESDERNFYDNSGWYIEDDKCLARESIHTESIQRFPRSQRADSIYSRIEELAGHK